jgi:hypothetical protein
LARVEGSPCRFRAARNLEAAGTIKVVRWTVRGANGFAGYLTGLSVASVAEGGQCNFKDRARVTAVTAGDRGFSMRLRKISPRNISHSLIKATVPPAVTSVTREPMIGGEPLAAR